MAPGRTGVGFTLAATSDMGQMLVSSSRIGVRFEQDVNLLRTSAPLPSVRHPELSLTSARTRLARCHHARRRM